MGCAAAKLLMYFYEEALEPIHTHVSVENKKNASLFCCPQFCSRKEVEEGWMWRWWIIWSYQCSPLTDLRNKNCVLWNVLFCFVFLSQQKLIMKQCQFSL